MISLRKWIDQIEEQERRFHEALSCYISAITGFEENFVPVSEELGYEHRQQLIQLSKRLGSKPTPEELQQSRIALTNELRDYHDKATGLLEKKVHEIKEILGVLADAVSSLTTQGETHSSKLTDFTRQIEMASKMTSLAEIRRRLVQELAQLKEWKSEADRERQASLSRLEGELKTFRRRLEKAERMAFTDTLTGIANRAEGEQRLDECLRSGERFSILLFDLNDFKGINDRYGHQVGDLVLKTFASRLAQHVRRTDTVCRWGGDEFLVILVNCSLDNALCRARGLAEVCSGEYMIQSDGQDLPVDIKTAVGAAEYWPGDKCDDLFGRADKFLYREKQMPSLSPAKRAGRERRSDPYFPSQASGGTSRAA
jgi:diguanylate cyclase (GGDEF)-like protein